MLLYTCKYDQFYTSVLYTYIDNIFFKVSSGYLELELFVGPSVQ